MGNPSPSNSSRTTQGRGFTFRRRRRHHHHQAANMSGKAKETASNTMEAILKKMLSLKNAKEAAGDNEKALQNKVLKSRDDEILQLGKKIMHVENELDDATEKLAADTLVNEEEVSALQRRCSLLDDDITRSDSRLTVESTKLSEAAKAAEEVEIQRKVLEAKNMVNEERIDSLDTQIATGQEVAIVSTKNCEEITRKLAMTQVELERTLEKAVEAEAKIQELEEQLNVVGQNMKTLELSETQALKRHEEYEEKIRDLILNLKFTEIQAAAAERESAKLQKELDALVEELNDWKEKYQEICVELEQTFNEMAGY